MPGFYFFDRGRGRRVRTSSWETFLSIVRELPRKSEVAQLESCACFSYGMPEERRKELRRALAERAIELVPSDDLDRTGFFCSCESTRREVLFDEVR